MKKVALSLLFLAAASASPLKEKLPFVAWAQPQFEKAKEIVEAVKSVDVVDMINK